MKAEQNDVHIGKDGWLFLTAGSNEALRLLADSTWFAAKDAQDWALKLANRQQRLQALGTYYVHMWVPDKIKVYANQLNFDVSSLTINPPAMVYDCAKALGVESVIVDPLPAMMAHKTDRLLYWKTDTHWTYWGACAAHQSLCQAINAASPDDLWNRPVSYISLELDLGAKLTPPVKESWGGAQVLRDANVVYKNEMVKFLELLNSAHAAPMLRGTCVRFKNSSENCDKRRVLVFGDSFSEYRPHLLTGLLAETFQDLLFVWSTSIDYGLVERFRPQVVITEMAERFIKTLPEKNIPEDGFNLESMVFDRITGFLNLRCSNGAQAFAWNKDYLRTMENQYA
jgi:alginate O-acetyltransferase complex protein AlgJ